MPIYRHSIIFFRYIADPYLQCSACDKYQVYPFNNQIIFLIFFTRAPMLFCPFIVGCYEHSSTTSTTYSVHLVTSRTTCTDQSGPPCTGLEMRKQTQARSAKTVPRHNPGTDHQRVQTKQKQQMLDRLNDHMPVLLFPFQNISFRYQVSNYPVKSVELTLKRL